MIRQFCFWICTVLVFCCYCASFSSCNSCDRRAGNITLVSGTLDGPLPADAAPAHVLEALDRAERLHQYEIMSDTACDISVEAIAEADTTSTEGYGIVVVKGAVTTVFPNLCHARSPMAKYDRKDDVLWLACSVMWGTGVQVDRLYRIRFDGNGKAYISDTVEPYDIQQQLCRRLGYSIDGQDVTLWDGGRRIASVTNSVADMGGLDDAHPVWIGEQLGYDLSGRSPVLLVNAGIKFVTGLVLIYDDMPTLSAPIGIDGDGKVDIGDIQ